MSESILKSYIGQWGTYEISINYQTHAPSSIYQKPIYLSPSLLRPFFFAMKINDIGLLSNAFIAFIAFSLTASAIYTLNDYHDIEEDREGMDLPEKLTAQPQEVAEDIYKAQQKGKMCFIRSGFGDG